MTDTPHLAHEIVISLTDGSITIDGAKLPWFISDDWTITGDVGGVSYLNIRMLAERIICTDTPADATHDESDAA